jgi:hypothetical protein
MDAETDVEIYTDIDTDIYTDIDMDIDRDMDKDSRYSAIWITCDISRRKFQQRYKLVVPLPNKNYDMLIFKKSYRHWDFSPNDVLAELEISVWGLKQGRYQRSVQ